MRNFKWLLLAPAFALLMAPTGGPTGGYPSRPKFQNVQVQPSAAAISNQPAWGTLVTCATAISPAINCISGSTQQNVLYTGANGSFPTGVTGYGQVSATGGGNQAFGMFARCDLYVNGTCTNEFDSFNFSTHEPTGVLPPNLAFGSADWNAVAFQVAPYGNNSSSIGINIGTGAGQKFLTGFYVNPGAVKTYGAYIGAPTTGGIGVQVNGSPVGPSPGLQVNAGACATCLGLNVNGNFTGAGNTNLVAFTDVNNTAGVNLLLGGNGVTTPNKTIRVTGGVLQILNSAYTVPILSLTDAGQLFTPAGTQLPVVAFASLPTCNVGNQGLMYGVNNALAPAYNAALAGGGAVMVIAFCNGASWTAH
jgi:hypothetical protein